MVPDRARELKFDLDSSIDLLRRTPTILRALLDGIPDEYARANEGPDTFSPFDNVGHLIDGEETDWMTRARIVLSDDNSEKSFTPYDRFRHYERNKGRTLESLLSEFERLRKQNLTELRGWNLDESDLDRTGVHPSFGDVTLRQLLAAWVVHDLGHIAQIARVMAKQYRDEVGPWVPFMPVLTDHERPRS
jgi:DinB family protein